MVGVGEKEGAEVVGGGGAESAGVVGGGGKKGAEVVGGGEKKGAEVVGGGEKKGAEVVGGGEKKGAEVVGGGEESAEVVGEGGKENKAVVEETVVGGRATGVEEDSMSNIKVLLAEMLGVSSGTEEVDSVTMASSVTLGLAVVVIVSRASSEEFWAETERVRMTQITSTANGRAIMYCQVEGRHQRTVPL